MSSETTEAQATDETAAGAVQASAGETTNSQASQNGGQGGSAQARELERQLDEARQKAKEAEARAQENLDRWQRAQADLANYRRRAQFEREEAEKYGSIQLVGSLLQVLDSFDRAWQTLPGQFRRLTWLAGVDMIHQQLRYVLQRAGLAEIEAQGKPFDPSQHEAVDHEAGEGPPHVVAVLQAGYTLNGRVIRPALVKVGPQPAAQAGAQGSETPNGAQVSSSGDQSPDTPAAGAAESA